MKNMGLVFAGGGVKGSYQVGVWKALEELGFKFDAVVGTSIGSINSALYVMGAFETAYKLWSEITIDRIVNIDTQSNNLFDIKNVVVLVNEIYKNNGLDVTPFKKLIAKLIDEDKIRRSDVNFGLVTHSLTDHKEKMLFKADIPDGQIADYILASACLPGFKSQVIDEQSFIDGGVNNNMPVDMLINSGIRDIVAVDVGGVGIIKNVDTTGVNIFTVKCSENVLGTMDFNAENIAKNIKMGYYDCYKTFGRCMGQRYYFESGDYCAAKIKYSEEILLGLEYAASAFKVNNYAIYKVDELVGIVIKKYREVKRRGIKLKTLIDKNGILQGISKVIPKIDDAHMIAWIVNQLEQKNSEILSNKLVMSVLGNNFTAANAIIYLMSEEK